jgi:hypothetical protein
MYKMALVDEALEAIYGYSGIIPCHPHIPALQGLSAISFIPQIRRTSQ